MQSKLILLAIVACSCKLAVAQGINEQSGSTSKSVVGKDGSVTMTFPRNISKQSTSGSGHESRQSAENKALEKVDKANDRRDEVWSTKHTAQERGQAWKEAADAKNAAEKEISKP